ERELVTRTTGTLGEVLGRAPRGWRSPGGLITPRTLGLLRDAGYGYDSSFGDDDAPYTVEVAADRADETLIELPWTWPLDDAPFYGHGGSGGIRRPADVVQMWIDEFDAALQLTGYFMLVCHPRFTGRPARIVAFERLIEHVKAQPGVWFARCD